MIKEREETSGLKYDWTHVQYVSTHLKNAIVLLNEKWNENIPGLLFLFMLCNKYQSLFAAEKLLLYPDKDLSVYLRRSSVQVMLVLRRIGLL